MEMITGLRPFPSITGRKMNHAEESDKVSQVKYVS
jgi:hypothetical protein